MEYVTHLREDGSYQPLKEHLEGTATRSAKFAASFGASSHAERTALLHDIGKYRAPTGSAASVTRNTLPRWTTARQVRRRRQILAICLRRLPLRGITAVCPTWEPVPASMMAHCAHG